MEKRDTTVCRAISSQKRVAIALWRLSTGNSFRSTAAVFGVGKSSAVQITKEFCVIMSQSARRYIKMPNNDRETAIAIENFLSIANCRRVLEPLMQYTLKLLPQSLTLQTTSPASKNTQ